MSLSEKAFSGFIWTFVSRLGTRLSIFIIGIILARLLTPADFGLIAILSVFFSISSSLVDSGFTQALIREKEITQKSKTTVFYINIIISLTLYIILWFCAPLIATFFDQPKLIWLTRVMALDIIFSALSIVQRASFTQQLRFKLLSAVDISVSIITGVVAIVLAYLDFGVWALAIKYFISSLFIFVIFYSINPWLPTGFIDKASFNRLFGFGSKLLLTGQINIIFNNAYNIIIGKIYSASLLGFYDRAYMFYRQSITTVLIAVQQVTYPVLSKINTDRARLKEAQIKLLNLNAFVILPITIILIFGAESIIIFFLGEKWKDSASFLQILSFSGFTAHLSINRDLFKVIGRSDIFLKISIINKVFVVLFIFIGIQFGVYGLVIGSIVAQYCSSLVTMYLSSKFIDYSLSNQISDYFKSISLIIPMTLFLLIFSFFQTNFTILNLIIILILGFSSYILTAYLSKNQSFYQLIEIVGPYIKKIRK